MLKCATNLETECRKLSVDGGSHLHVTFTAIKATAFARTLAQFNR